MGDRTIHRHNKPIENRIFNGLCVGPEFVGCFVFVGHNYFGKRMISVQEVRGVDRIKAKLDKLPVKIRGIATTEAAKYLIGNERRGLQYYPPPPAMSMYARTYNLRFGWQVSSWLDMAKTKILNKVKYAPYVQGDGTQAWMHVGRWRTVSRIVRDNMQGALKAIDEAVARYLRGEGLGR